MTFEEWITLFFVSAGAVAMAAAILMTRQLIPFVLESTFRRHWHVLKLLMVFFFAGYLAVDILILSGHIDWLAILTGVIFLFGAIFVLLVVYSSFLTIRELNTTSTSKHELEQINAQLAEANERALLASQSKSDFLASMSHELRTPLNAIMGFSQLLELDSDAMSEEQKSQNAHILDASKHLLVLINSVLDLNRIESGHLELNPDHTHIFKLVEEVTTLLDPLAKNRNISVLNHCDPQSIAFADPVRLKQIVINLLSNAIKYNRSGGQVEISTYRISQQMIKIAVQDNGPGIPEEKQKTIFAPFERLELHKNQVEGTGIGLALVEQLTSAMGGSVGVESTPGQGSCFWITLPVEPEKSDHP